MKKLVKIIVILLMAYFIYLLVTPNKDPIPMTYKECSEIHSHYESIKECMNS